MEIFSYALQFAADPNGGFVVTSRDLPEVVTQGDTRAQAIAEAEGALQAAIEMRMQDGLPIPPASTLEAGEEWLAVPDRHGDESRALSHHARARSRPNRSGAAFRC